MNEERLCQKNIGMVPPERRRKGRTRILWKQEVTTGMRKNEINCMESTDREEWKRNT